MVPIFIGLAIAMGYDAIVGSAMVYVGAATGFAAATLNPFTIGVAQQIAGVEYGSGVLYRVLCAVVFGAIAIGYTMWYAHRVKKDPAKSIVYGEKRELSSSANHERLMSTKATLRQRLCGLLFLFTIALLLFGTVRLKWLALVVIGGEILFVTADNPGGHIAHLGGALAGLWFAASLAKGHDLTAWINRAIDGVYGLFRPRPRKPKMKVRYGTGRQKDYDYNAARKARTDEIDRILDKLKKSGYGSLTAEEKKRLFDESKR